MKYFGYVVKYVVDKRFGFIKPIPSFTDGNAKLIGDIFFHVNDSSNYTPWTNEYVFFDVRESKGKTKAVCLQSFS